MVKHLLILLLTLSACSYYKPKHVDKNGQNGQMSDYLWLQTNLFDVDCVQCHRTGLNLTSYDGMTSSVGMIAPGEPAASRIFQMVNTRQMPPRGSLSNTRSMEMLQCWIEKGALNEGWECQKSLNILTQDTSEPNKPSTTPDGQRPRTDGTQDSDSAGHDDTHGGYDDDDDDSHDDDDDSHDDGGNGDGGNGDGGNGDGGNGDGGNGDGGNGDTGDGGNGTSTDPVDEYPFAEVNDRVFVPFCLGCHDSEYPAGDLSVQTYDNVMESGFVTAGDPGNSKLYNVIDSDFMPYNAPLPLELKEVVRLWIENGAQP